MKFDIYYYLDKLKYNEEDKSFLTILLQDVFDLQNSRLYKTRYDGICFKKKNEDPNTLEKFVFNENPNSLILFEYYFKDKDNSVELFLNKNEIKYSYTNKEQIFNFTIPRKADELNGSTILRCLRYDFETFKRYKSMKNMIKEPISSYMVDCVDDFISVGFSPDEEYEMNFEIGNESDANLQLAQIFHNLISSPLEYCNNYSEEIKNSKGSCLILN